MSPRRRTAGCGALLLGWGLAALAAPRVPQSDDEILAQVPAGASHVAPAARALARARSDVALPIAQLYIERARHTGDLRLLGLAEATLQPWLSATPTVAAAWVLQATILQSRHDFSGALLALDRALGARADDPQAWLTRAAILRVLARYDEAQTACRHLAASADAAVSAICVEGTRALTGGLRPAYAALERLSVESAPVAVRAWRDSELAEMAERAGDSAAAERWFRHGLALAPEDLYLLCAYADLLLAQGRAREALHLLEARAPTEPVLLRAVLAGERIHDDRARAARAQLSTTFTLEAQRGDPVHRREQARFLLDVEHRASQALSAAEGNWQVQREPEDALILLRAAAAAHRPDAAQIVLRFIAEHRLEDARLERYRREVL